MSPHGLSAASADTAPSIVSPEIRVVVVDARRLIGDSLALLVGAIAGFTVTSVLVNGNGHAAGAIGACDLVLVGIGAEEDESIALARAIRRAAPDIPLVLVADSVSPEVLEFGIECGVSGLLPSTTTRGELGTSLAHAIAGRVVFPAGWQRVLAAREKSPLASLSQRQREVLDLLALGCSNEEIAAQLVISLNTVKFHIRTIYSRLGVHNRLAAVRHLRSAS